MSFFFYWLNRKNTDGNEKGKALMMDLQKHFAAHPEIRQSSEKKKDYYASYDDYSKKTMETLEKIYDSRTTGHDEEAKGYVLDLFNVLLWNRGHFLHECQTDNMQGYYRYMILRVYWKMNFCLRDHYRLIFDSNFDEDVSRFRDRVCADISSTDDLQKFMDEEEDQSFVRI